MKTLAHPRFLAFLAILICATAALATRLSFEQALVYGFDVAALVFLVSCVPLWGEAVATANRNRAARDDGGRLFLLIVVIATLIAVLSALVRLVQERATLTWFDVAPAVVTLALSWAFVNTVYAFHYDHSYYDQIDGSDIAGIEFPGTREPVFSDFCYFAFTIGMTCQTSDVIVHSTRLRRAVLIHGILSYVFNLGVLAMVINLLAGVL